MKTASLFALLLLSFSLSTYAFEDGTYNCGSQTDFYEVTYKVKTLTLDGVQLPYLDITQNYYKKPNDPNSKDRTYQVKGVANLFADDNGNEILVLGNMDIELTAGKITCKK